MTQMLASVMSRFEARIALEEKVDIIDLKQPHAGALGALDTGLVATIVQDIAARCQVSATIGDLPMQPEPIIKAINAMSETGVDFIKIGFFPEGDMIATLEKIAGTPRKNYALIAVLFADIQPDFAIISLVKKAGFSGVMLDTMDKKKGALTQVMTRQEIERFVDCAKNEGLLCGLAGSLKLEDVTRLMPFVPDYLGFRGALCAGHDRIAEIDGSAIGAIKQAISFHNAVHLPH